MHTNDQYQQRFFRRQRSFRSYRRYTVEYIGAIVAKGHIEAIGDIGAIEDIGDIGAIGDIEDIGAIGDIL